MKSTIFVIAICLILFVNNVFAQQIVTDRPDQTESSFVVDEGSLQIESGLLLGFSDLDGISYRSILAPTTLFRLGIVKGVELRLVSQYESNKIKNSSIKTNGISDIELGFKIGVLNKEGVNINIAFLSHLLIPTGTEELSNDKVATINKMAFSHELSDNVGLGYNVGYNYWGRESGDITYSMALGYSLTSKIGLYIETYGDYADMHKIYSNMDTGLTYLLKDNFQLDFSFGTGINHTMNYLALGFSWNIRSEK